VDLRTAIVAIAGLHEPPCLLPEDEQEPALPTDELARANDAEDGSRASRLEQAAAAAAAV
jgi:hypothetical protein